MLPGTTNMSAMRSSFASAIDLTPRDWRPLARKLASTSKRIAWPRVEQRSTESAAVHSEARTSSSPSWSETAMRPRAVMREKASSGVRLIQPWRVRRTRKTDGENSDTGSKIAMFSPSEMGSSWCASTPRDVREVAGTLYAGSAYATPVSERQRIVSCELHVNICITASPSRMLVMPALPRVPRCCASNSSSGRRFMYPATVRMMMLCSFAVRSISSRSASDATPSLVRRGVPKRALRSLSSSLISSSNLGRSSSKPLSSAIVAPSVSPSSASVERSSAVRRRSCIERMASVCASERPNGSEVSAARASPTLPAERIVATTSSIRSCATSRPCTKWRRVSAFWRR